MGLVKFVSINAFVVILAAVVVYSTDLEANKGSCYSCNSPTDKGCEDPLNATLITSKCPLSDNNTVCTSYTVTKGNTTTTSRGCVTLENKNNTKIDACEAIKSLVNKNASYFSCYSCNFDLCNNATIPKSGATFATPLVSLVMGAIFVTVFSKTV